MGLGIGSVWSTIGLFGKVTSKMNLSARGNGLFSQQRSMLIFDMLFDFSEDLARASFSLTDFADDINRERNKQ